MEDIVLTREKNNHNFSLKRKYTLEVVTGDKVLEFFSDDSFCKDWEGLYDNCPWATVYQSIGFVGSWYNIYHEKYLPILMITFEEGELRGVLPLCLNGTKKIVGAGLNQAEYQTWITTKEDSDSFIQAAIIKLNQHFPGHHLQLKYIPAQTPLNWIQENPFWNKSAWLQPSRHPIMRIDKKALGDQLRKKNKREKVNRLKRLGDLKFERITDYTAFLEIFDELATHNDFRKGAVYNTHHFQEDSLSKDFMLSLFNNNLLHATVLKVDKEIIASNVGTVGRNWVHLQGINTHSPSHAKHSPGILHFLMLGQLMADEGLEVFDLTPGSDPYKDTLATDYLEAYDLTIKSPYSQMVSKMKFRIANRLKTSLMRLGISQPQQRNYKNSLSNALEKIKIVKSHGPSSLLKAGFWRLGALNAPQFYIIPAERFDGGSLSDGIRRNMLKDLLVFEPGETLLTRWEFLEDAMKRLEAGQQFYSLLEDSRLICCVWVDKPSPPKKDKKQEFPPRKNPPSQLTNLYFHRIGKNKVRLFLHKVAEKVNQTGNNGHAFALFRSKNKRISEILEKSGFSQKRD